MSGAFRKGKTVKQNQRWICFALFFFRKNRQSA